MDLVYSFLILVTLFQTYSAFNSQSRYGPCSRMFCGRGRTCVEIPAPCFNPSCPLQGLCVPLASGRSCPRTSDFGVCVAYCSTDADCGRTEMCCGSCPRRCVPVGIQTPQKPVIKPGSCPLSRGKPGSCTSSCTSDQSCPGNKKCCGRCPRHCETPVESQAAAKPGRCPAPVRDVVGICVVSCKADKECPGDKKCCGSCPRECKNPLSSSGTKPGRCPMSRKYRLFLGGCNTASKCLRDIDCPGDQKCCGKCPRLCVNPRGTGQTSSRRLQSVSARSQPTASRVPLTGFYTSRRRRQLLNPSLSRQRDVPPIRYQFGTFNK